MEQLTEPIDVLVCDDHTVFAQSLATALEGEPWVRRSGWSGSAEEAAARAEAERPALVVVDLRMPGVEGTELIERFASLDDPPKVLVLSVASDGRSIVRAFEAGAGGFVGKHESLHAVIDACHEILAGHAPISASAFARILPRLVPAHAERALTAREEGVLEQLAVGASNDEIADELVISPNTVRNHVSNILEKLGVENRRQAVVEGRRRGLLD